MIEKFEFDGYRMDKINMEKLESKINEIVMEMNEREVIPWTDRKITIKAEPCTCDGLTCSCGKGLTTTDALPSVTLTKKEDE